MKNQIPLVDKLKAHRTKFIVLILAIVFIVWLLDYSSLLLCDRDVSTINGVRAIIAMQVNGKNAEKLSDEPLMYLIRGDEIGIAAALNDVSDDKNYSASYYQGTVTIQGKKHSYHSSSYSSRYMIVYISD